MIPDITLRAATAVDAGVLARLWVETFPDKFGPVLGQKAEVVLRDWFRLSRRHLQTTTLAEIEQDVAGFIVLETPGSPCPDDGRWLWHALQLHNGLAGALRGLLLMLAINNNHRRRPDEVYVELLGVTPAWQGQGIARHLLNHAEAIARTQNINQLCLNVVTDNVPALCLYEKRGFQVKARQRSRLLQWITGHPGYYEMVKAL